MGKMRKHQVDRKHTGQGRNRAQRPAPAGEDLTGSAAFLSREFDGFSHNSDASVDTKHRLYQQAVQAPRGEISYLLRFYRDHVGLQAPTHLREDFCGAALICATWCKADVRRTALGVDIDAVSLRWGWQNNVCPALGGSCDRVCLVHSNVLDDVSNKPLINSADVDPAAEASAPPADALPTSRGDCTAEDGSDSDDEQDLRLRPADIVCALNFSVCLLHTRADVLRYFRHVRQAISPEGGVFVLDLLGGPAAESNARIQRHNDVTGMQYLWEQVGWNPVTRHIRCYISLRDPESKQVLSRVWTYPWRLWTLPDVLEMLREAGFPLVDIWLRPIKDAGAEESGSADGEDVDYQNYQPGGPNADLIASIKAGWTAYLVGVVQGCA